MLGYLLVMTIVTVVFMSGTRATIMNTGWVESEMDKVGFYTAIKNEFIDSIDDSFADNLAEAEVENTRIVVDEAVTEEWIEENFEENIDLIYAYLKSESDDLSLSLTLTQDLKDGMKENVEIVFEDNPPVGLTPDEVTAGIDAVKQQLDNLPDEIALQMQNVQELQPARDVIRIYNYIFYILIALAFLLAVSLIFFHFTINDAARVLGIVTLIGGAVSLIDILVIRSLAPRIIGEGGLSDHITADMMVQVMRDSTTPAYIFSIVLIVVAVLLIVASFFIRRKNEAAQLEPLGVNNEDKFSSNPL